MYLAMHKNDPQFLSTDINQTKQTEVALKGTHQLWISTNNEQFQLSYSFEEMMSGQMMSIQQPQCC